MVSDLRVDLAHRICEMKPVPKTARIRRFIVDRLSPKHDSVPPGVTPFVLLTTERSGSSLMLERLSAQWTAIRSDGEVFNPEHRRGRSFDAILSRTYFAHTGHRFVGCKVIRKQVQEEEIRSVLSVPSMRVVVLERCNLVRQFVSLKIAQKDRMWKQLAHTPRSAVESRAVGIEVDELLTYWDRQTRVYRRFDELVADLPCLRVTYEELTGCIETTIRNVGEFLGAGPPDRSAPLRYRQQNPEPLRDLIINFEQLKFELAAAGHERLVCMLDA